MKHRSPLPPDLRALLRLVHAAPTLALGSGALLSLLGVGCEGCTCDLPPVTSVFPIDASTYQELQTRYGANPIPLDVCQAVCPYGPPTTTASVTGAGGAGGVLGAGGAGGVLGVGGMLGASGAGGVLGAGGAGGVLGAGGAGGVLGAGGAGGVLGVGGAGGALGAGGAGGVLGVGGGAASTTASAGGALASTSASTSTGLDDPYVGNLTGCEVTTIELTQPAVSCTYTQSCGGVGRRPAGLTLDARVAGRSVGAYVARAAALEAASVVAFVELAAELDAHGGAPELVRWALEAAHEEVHHARAMAQLGRALGVAPEAVHVAPRPTRSLEAIALHNAEEGLASEAFGAALLAEQARHAAWPGLGRVLDRIAREEQRHADFSRALGAHLVGRLGPGAARRTREMREHALDEIARDHAHEPSPHGAALLGLPSAERAQTILAGVRSRA